MQRRLVPLLIAFCLTLPAAVRRESFGQTRDGRAVDLFTLTNTHGLEVRVMAYGATVVSIRTPDRRGQSGDVILGFDTLAGYLGEHPYFGAVVGRYGNRIAKGEFALKGKTYHLARNNNGNHLHGGLKGFDKVVWNANPQPDRNAVVFRYTSPDGEEGYPGRLEAEVTYTLTERNELKIHYLASTDQDTVVNLTNHTYFNLSGQPTILNDQIRLYASRFTPVDAGLIPTGERKSVISTPFDFRRPFAIGARIEQKDQQIEYGGGYDHNWILDGPLHHLHKAAELYSPVSGRLLEVSTTEPGVQFYTGNFLDGSITGKGGRRYERRSGLCLETQHFPDSPNQPAFPSTVLKPGAKYESETVWKFSVRN